MKRATILLFTLFGLMITVHAQDDDVKYLSIAGRIMDKDSKEAMGGVMIMNETRNQTVASKVNGFYSIVAAPGDIIRFTHVGYEPEYMRVNETSSTKATVMVYLQQDDYYIEEVIVGELPSEEELIEYFMGLDVEDDKSRELVEQNPETFKILDNIEEPKGKGPITFISDNIKKLTRKKKKPGRKKDLPKYKD